MVEQYHGNYVTAESASNYIDINAIVSGCQNLAENGEGFDYISKKFIQQEILAMEMLYQ